MIVLYNLLVILVMAFIVKLGITYTDYEEIFVAIGVIDIVYLVCLLFYVVFSS